MDPGNVEGDPGNLAPPGMLRGISSSLFVYVSFSIIIYWIHVSFQNPLVRNSKKKVLVKKVVSVQHADGNTPGLPLIV